MTIETRGIQGKIFLLGALLLALLNGRVAVALPPTSGLYVVASSADGPAGPGGYMTVDGAMQGVVHRDDGSTGSYRVPVTLSYPTVASACNGSAIVDVVNSVLFETFPWMGTTMAPPADLDLIPGVYQEAVATIDNGMYAFSNILLGQDAFVRDSQYGGYVHAEVQWNKLVIDRQRRAGTGSDPTFHIERGTDGYLILRDISRALRNLSAHLLPAATGAPPSACAVSDVLAFGYSQTGQLLRGMYIEKRNSGLALGDPGFDDGLVFEGAIHGAAGGSCRRMEDVEPYYGYRACAGATPQSEGLVLSVNTETDVQVLEGWTARSGATLNWQDHYRSYEIAGTAHIPPGEPNHADTSPVHRALTHQLDRWIDDPSDAPPESVWLDGFTVPVPGNLFSPASWGSHHNVVFQTVLGEDLNATGGIRLAHVLTPHRGGSRGAPVGMLRGSECFGGYGTANYVLGCYGFADDEIYAVNSGITARYHPNTEPCRFFDHADQLQSEAYEGASWAASQGWILPEDIAPMVDRIVAYAAEDRFCGP